MSENNHTPEPWRIGAMESGLVAIDGADGSEVTGFINPEDARRIIACLQSCSGIPTEQLEAYPGAVLRVMQQRDELLVALENGRRFIDLISPFEGDVTRQIDKAIASVKGQK